MFPKNKWHANYPNLFLKLPRAVFFCFLTVAFVVVFFHGVPNSNFIFSHDEYFPFPGHEIGDLFYVRSYLDFGSSATVSLTVTLFDRIYYAIAYSSGLGLQSAQVLLYGLKLFSILYLPYLGFHKLALRFVGKVGEEVVLLTSLWYSFNTYTLIYWHINAFSLGALICYALAPLALYWWEWVVFQGGKPPVSERLKGVLILALLLFFMSFALYLFAAFLAFLAAYTILRLSISRQNLRPAISGLLMLVVACIPLFIIHIVVVYEVFSPSTAVVNAIGGDTNEMLKGGLLYMSYMWFSWAIYTDWTARSIFTFSDYLHSTISILAPFVLYGLIFWGALRQRRNAFIIVFSLLFLFFLLLAKGPQEPLGSLYLYMLEYVPGFRVFRSPDTKFGFLIVLSVAVLLILVGRAINAKVFVIMVGAVVMIQCWPLITGVAIRGENKAGGYDRVIYIPNEYQQLADYLNSPACSFGYIMTLPFGEFATYRFGKDEGHIGQDLLPKMIKLPFVYLSESSGMAAATYKKLKHFLQIEDYAKLRQFAIRYYVVRHDMKKEDINNSQIEFIKKHFKLVFHNSLFHVYEDTSALPLIDGGHLTFDVKNPVRIDVKFGPHAILNLLVLHQNYNSGWHLYAATSKMALENRHGKLMAIFINWFGTASFLWKTPISVGSHRMDSGYANVWDISKAGTTSTTPPRSTFSERDPLIPSELTIFYWPQALFCLLAGISTLFVVGYLIVISTILIRARRAH